MSCFPSMAYMGKPACKPDPANNIYECSDLKLKGDCCLSKQTTSKTISNCPKGWESNPTEYCTEALGILSNTYRHKCIRSCANPLLDPRSGCTKCSSNPLLDPKTDCKTCANKDQDLKSGCKKCTSPLVAYPDCKTCVSNSLLDPKTDCKTCTNKDQDPKSGCKTCANPLLAYPDCKTCLSNQLLAPPTCKACTNSLFAAPKCTACSNSLLNPKSGCLKCSSNPLLDPKDCKTCANSLYAAPGCDSCFNPLFAFPDCTSCSITEQDSGNNCESCTNPLLEYPGCVECLENKLLAPQECTSCLDTDRVAPKCEKCRQGMFLNPDTNTCTMCGETDCAKAGCECAQGNCVGGYCNCITTVAPYATNSRTDQMYQIKMYPNNTAFVYAPMEMFEVNAPFDIYGGQVNYWWYVWGFWGFIQISGHQIIAREVVEYNSGYNRPALDKCVGISLGERAAGVKDYPGYRNAVEISGSLFNAPKGLALDKTKVDGKYTRPTVFVADSGNNCIRMISVTITDAGGTKTSPLPGTVGVSTLTGSNWSGILQFGKDLPSRPGKVDGNLSEALFNNPTGLDFDSNGVLYVADTGNNAIRKIVIDQATVNLQKNRVYTGKVTTLKIEPALVDPVGVLFHDGWLYVCDNSTIRKIDVLNTQLSKPIATGLYQPYGMVFKGKNLLFSDAYGVKILVNAGQMPPDIRPAPFASEANNRPLAMMEYRGNIVVGLKDKLAVQISGKDCTCFPDIPGNC